MPLTSGNTTGSHRYLTGQGGATDHPPDAENSEAGPHQGPATATDAPAPSQEAGPMSTIRKPDRVGSPPVSGSPQPELFDVSAFEADRPPTITERAEAFDQAHPQVYRVLVKLAREWVRDTGQDRLGIAMIWEVARWRLIKATGEKPKMNNSYKAYFARKIMQREADLAGLFETRQAEADQSMDLAA